MTFRSLETVLLLIIILSLLFCYGVYALANETPPGVNQWRRADQADPYQTRAALDDCWATAGAYCAALLDYRDDCDAYMLQGFDAAAESLWCDVERGAVESEIDDLECRMTDAEILLDQAQDLIVSDVDAAAQKARTGWALLDAVHDDAVSLARSMRCARPCTGSTSGCDGHGLSALAVWRPAIVGSPQTGHSGRAAR